MRTYSASDPTPEGTMAMKPFRIFRPGKHTASCGTAIEFTEDDLKRAVAAYNPEIYAAPLVIGHPKQEDRAYGWAESLSYDDGYVVAHPDKVEPAFSEMVEKGAYRNRSAAWYMPDHPNNPSPGNLYPKHIGFLGAVPPALKGLGDVQFAAEDHPELILEFTDAAEEAWSLSSFMSSVASMLRGFRDTLIADKGLEEADKTLPNWQISDIEAQAAKQTQKARAADTATPQPAFSEPTPQSETTTMSLTPEQIAAQTAENAALKAQVASFTERETAIKAAEIQAAIDAADRELQPLVEAGKVLPAHRKTLAAFMASLDDKEQVVEFGEAKDGVVPKVSNRAFMSAFLSGLPRTVTYGESAAVTGANSGGLTPKQLAEKATDLRAKVQKETGRTLSFTEATNRVLSELGVSVAEASKPVTSTEDDE
jgi:hypothetical protein